jgi:type II secretory pathway component GspD/PulD (secretin)
MNFRLGLLGLILVVALRGSSLWAQPEPSTRQGGETVKTLYLSNTSQINDTNEIMTIIRNVLPPSTKIYPSMATNAIVIRATPEQISIAEKLISDLDRPKKTYRVTYTISETDAGKRIGVQHFAVIVVGGQRTLLKQGSRVPISTGTIKADTTPQNQMQYLDVGMNFDVTLVESGSGVMALRSKVEQSSVAEEKSGFGALDPVIRQTLLEGSAFLTAGKPVTLGSLDVAGSTRHLDVEVVMEPVK